MRLQANFSFNELRSRCLRQPSQTQMRNIIVLAWVLQLIRNQIRRALIVRSGWRSAEHNASINGHPQSFHVDALACDVSAPGMTSKHLGEVIFNMQKMNIIPSGKVIVYPTFVHYQMCGEHEIIYK
jgi:uncharacterized protein YcbK (DUF882 family)